VGTAGDRKPFVDVSNAPRTEMDGDNLIEMTHTSVFYYKARNGEVKELHVKQPMDPNQKIFTLADLQLLGREIAKVLKEDAF
jgi:hypothetical protein